MFWLCIFSWVICIWVIFFNGAEKLEGTFLGYFEFGQFAEDARHIKVFSWLSVIITTGFVILGY